MSLNGTSAAVLWGTQQQSGATFSPASGTLWLAQCGRSFAIELDARLLSRLARWQSPMRWLLSFYLLLRHLILS